MQITEMFCLQDNVQQKKFCSGAQNVAFGYTSKPPHPNLGTPERNSRHATDDIMLVDSGRCDIARIKKQYNDIIQIHFIVVFLHKPITFFLSFSVL